MQILKLLTIICVFTVHGPATCAQWPAFHGPNGNCVSNETGLLDRWSQEGGTPKLLWVKQGIGLDEEEPENDNNYSGYSSPAIQGNRIVLTGNYNGESCVYALDTDGNSLWTVANGPQWTEMFPGTRGTPCIDDDCVYDESPHGNLVCLSLENGQTVWKRNLLEEHEVPNLLYGRSGSVLIRGERLFITLGGKNTPAMLCLDKKTGKTLWSSPSTGFNAAYGTPCFFELPNGKKTLAAFDAKGIFVLDAESGELYFHFDHRARLDENISTPIYKDGALFVTNGAGSDSVLLKLTPTQDALKYEVLWKNRLLANSHGGVVLIDGLLYGATNKRGSGWACVRWKDGEDVFFDRKTVRGSLCYAEGLLYILTEFGELVLAKPGREALEVRGRYLLPGEHTGQVYAHPAICDKRLYARIGHRLYCFDIAK